MTYPLTIFSTARGQANYIVTNASIIYENEARVNTSFVTNLGKIKISNEPELEEKIKQANIENTRKEQKELPIYNYPANVLTASMINNLGKRGIRFEVQEKDVQFIRGLDAQKEDGKSIYGAGFLISNAAAEEKERKEMERKESQYVWQLSEREKEIIKKLG